MEALLLDEQFNSICLIDSYESFIWTERYYGYGDFEIYTVPTPELLSVVQQDYYIWLKDAYKVMIIEGIQLSSEVETGGHLIISGRSLESILDRRIIWNQTVLSGNLQNAIQKLLNENAISPSDSNRQIPRLYFNPSIDSRITGLTISAQYTGDNLYDTIDVICRTYKLGYSIDLDENDNFAFSLYAGVDRSYNQFVNPWVVFSPQNENLISSKYLESKKTLKNVNLVAGGEKDGVRKRKTVGSASYLARREMYTDARDIQSEKSDQTIMPDEEYYALLNQRGLEKLAEHITTITFEGKLETKFGGYIYGKNPNPSSLGAYFYLGDIVQITNEFGISRMARVEEMVRSLNTSGYEVYPTFSIVEEV